MYLSKELFLLVDGRLFRRSKKSVMIGNMPANNKGQGKGNDAACTLSPGKMIDIMLRKLVPTVVIVVL